MITRSIAGLVLCASAAAASAPFALLNSSAFERRSDFALADAAGQLLLLGGGNYSVNYTVYRDVFPFLGGVVVTPAWSALAYHTAVVLPSAGTASRIVVSGGGHCRMPFNGSVCLTYDWFNENWASDDGGVSWHLLSIGAWAPRGGHTTNLLNGVAVLTGGMGVGDVQFGDVWASDDGLVTWRQVTAAAPWLPRSFHSALVVQPTDPSLCPLAKHGEMLLLAAGGGDYGTFADVWRTCDGVEWAPVTLAAPWSPRIGTTINLVTTLMTATATAGAAIGNVSHTLVLAGGMSNLSTPGLSDVWRSADYGASWTMVAADGAGGFIPRSYHGAIAGPVGSRCPPSPASQQHQHHQHQQQEQDQQVVSSPLYLMGGWTVDVDASATLNNDGVVAAPAAWRLHGGAAAAIDGAGVAPTSWYYVYFGDVYCADGGVFNA